MRIVIDDRIPYIREAIGRITPDAVYIRGSEITAADVRDADALIVRTRTVCDGRLLGGSRVRFVATATIGYDHIDTEYMERAGITWMNCPGCNSGSVAQYVRSSLILLRRQGLLSAGGTIGVVGCGHVGGKVKAVAEGMGFRTLVCDPPLHGSGVAACSASLGDIAAACDAITFHVPLTRGGKYPTYHLADRSFLGSLQNRPVIINTSRGAVVDNAALLEALDGGRVRAAVVDTWENEPDINLRLLEKTFIGTPHIAGYSADGKVNADNMVIEGLCRFFGIRGNFHIEPPALPAAAHPCPDDPDDRCLALYNPLDDSRRLKDAPEKFEELRGNYPLRRES